MVSQSEHELSLGTFNVWDKMIIPFLFEGKEFSDETCANKHLWNLWTSTEKASEWIV